MANAGGAMAYYGGYSSSAATLSAVITEHQHRNRKRQRERYYSRWERRGLAIENNVDEKAKLCEARTAARRSH